MNPLVIGATRGIGAQLTERACGDVAHFILGEPDTMKYAGQTPLLAY